MPHERTHTGKNYPTRPVASGPSFRERAEACKEQLEIVRDQLASLEPGQSAELEKMEQTIPELMQTLEYLKAEAQEPTAEPEAMLRNDPKQLSAMARAYARSPAPAQPAACRANPNPKATEVDTMIAQVKARQQLTTQLDAWHHAVAASHAEHPPPRANEVVAGVLVGGGPSAASSATATAVAMPAGPGPTSQPVAASSGAASAGAPPGSRVSHLSGSRFGERMGRLWGSSTRPPPDTAPVYEKDQSTPPP